MGIDVGVRSAVAVAVRDGEPGAVGVRRWATPVRSMDGVRILGRLAVLTFAAPPFNEASVCWIERPMGRQIKEVSDLARAGGSIAACIPSHVALDEIPPPDWKRLVGLGGNATKAVVRTWALEDGAGPDVLADEHAADAYAIARAIWKWSERGESND